jgi:polo-like kinase 1
LKGDSEKKLSTGHPSHIKVETASNSGPQATSKILLSKWVDYSSKYGIGAKLSNEVYVVLFNDSTKLVLHHNNFNFVYI